MELNFFLAPSGLEQLLLALVVLIVLNESRYSIGYSLVDVALIALNITKYFWWADACSFVLVGSKVLGLAEGHGIDVQEGRLGAICCSRRQVCVGSQVFAAD